MFEQLHIDMIRGISREGLGEWGLRGRFPVAGPVFAREPQHHVDLRTVAGGRTVVGPRIGVEGLNGRMMDGLFV